MDAHSAPALRLPSLRQDLQLLQGPAAEDGEPGWLVYDALRHRYFRIGLDAFRLLGMWLPGGDADTLLARAQSQGLDIDREQVAGLVRFLSDNQLVQADGPQAVATLRARHERARQNWFQWLIHHYLFIRIPLWRPDAFLRRTLPWVAPLFDSRLLWAIRGLGLVGLLLVLQQWEQFSATFLHFFSWEGLAWYGVVLLAVKSAHELGHAYVATRLGCRVASIGVAFLVMFPVLYTDTTDAWRLRRRRDRLAIVTAGVGTELHLAMLATFAWSFMADGPWRSVAFFVATTSWVTSLAVNLSPFMRFDGYFALSDLLGAQNLQPRAFALGRWRLREWLFGFGEPPPERLATRRAALFIAYAYATWAYRFFLFIGIALLVYHFAFKALGILLFLVEIVWFIAMPLKNEIMAWWERRTLMRPNRHLLATGLGLLALVLLLAVPWRGSLGLPAVVEAGAFQQVYPGSEGRINGILVQEGQSVRAGDPLVTLSNPRLEQEMVQARREMALLQLRASRLAGSGRELQEHLVTQQQLARLETQLRALQAGADLLVVRAPVAGTVSYLAQAQVGQWVSADSLLLSLRAAQGLRVVAFVPESDLHRIEPGARGVWISDLGHGSPIPLRLTRIDDAAVPVLGYPELASEHGGPVAVRRLADGQYRPEQALYRLELAPTRDQPAPGLREPGVLRIEATPRSVLAGAWAHAAAVLVKESGF